MFKEIFGDLFSYDKRPGFKICITTNGFIKNNEEGVMGAGCAKQAAKLYPDLPRLLGVSLRQRGNVVSSLTEQYISFPVKHNWWEDADMNLIVESTIELKKRALQQPNIKFILPRPGCGNGKLDWKAVRGLLVDLDLPENIWIVAPWNMRPMEKK